MVPCGLGVPASEPQAALSQEFVTIFCGTGAAHPAEHARKVLLCFEAARYGDVQDAHLGHAQHLFGALYPLAKDKLMWAFARRLAKYLREVSRAQLR